MRGFRSLASVLAIARLTATYAAPTSEMRSDHAGRPMATELHGSRDMTYLDTSRAGSGRMAARLVQNVDPDKVPLPTWTSAVGALDASQTGIGADLPGVSGSKWVLVPNTQVGSGGNASTGTDMKSRNQAQNESGGLVVNITAWTLGRENSLGAGVVVVLALTAVLVSNFMSLWYLRRMKELLESAVEQMQRGQAGVPSWTFPVKPSEMWPMPAPPSPLSPRTAETGAVYSLGHRSGMRHGACPLRTTC